jgi:hypothetical protein
MNGNEPWSGEMPELFSGVPMATINAVLEGDVFKQRVKEISCFPRPVVIRYYRIKNYTARTVWFFSIHYGWRDHKGVSFWIHWNRNPRRLRCLGMQVWKTTFGYWNKPHAS